MTTNFCSCRSNFSKIFWVMLFQNGKESWVGKIQHINLYRQLTDDTLPLFAHQFTSILKLSGASSFVSTDVDHCLRFIYLFYHLHIFALTARS